MRYRFGTIVQARAHVHAVAGRQLFFYRDQTMRLLPYAPVSIEWTFHGSEPARLVHGWVLGVVEGAGTWIELVDTRQLREVSTTDFRRKGRRLGCDLLVRVRSGERVETLRMLDVSDGGARIAGQLERGASIEVELLAADRVTFRRLGPAYVRWSEGGEMGVQFDRLDSRCRAALKQLADRVAEVWDRAWDASHPRSCCAGAGVLDPPPPRLKPREAGADSAIR